MPHPALSAHPPRRLARRTVLGAAAGLSAGLLAACGGARTSNPAPTAALDAGDWDAVVAAARGQEVAWYVWGGSDGINEFIDTTYGPVLESEYGVTLRRVPVTDTVDAVNQVVSESAAGVDPGAVDLIWINGENFASLKEAGLLRGGWSRELPHAALVDWEDPAVAFDFGVPVEGYESPWSSAQLQLVHDTARTDPADLPRSYAALLDWARANPGRFTYIAPGPDAFQGTRFLKGALFELSGDAEQWADHDPDLWARWAPDLWAYLTELRPHLWRAGETYPRDENELHRLFANGEVDMTLTQAITGAGTLIADGLVPETAQAFVFDDYMIGDHNYVAIPVNAPHPAAALVLANLLLEPELQAAQILPENGFGLGYAIDVTRVQDPQARAELDAAAEALGPAAVPPAELAAARVNDSAPEYQGLLEDEWRGEILVGAGS
ncbi:MAG: ABC transporter substrate-binding protein [Kineosporiaceae bacterium]